jgi:hypothetical protein
MNHNHSNNCKICNVLKTSKPDELGSSLQRLLLETVSDLETGIEINKKTKDKILQAAKKEKIKKLKAWLTLEGLTVCTDEDAYDEAGVGVFGDYGEEVKYNVGADLMEKRKTIYYFKTPLIWGDVSINGSEMTWKTNSSREKESESAYTENGKNEDAVKDVKLYRQWEKQLSHQLNSILQQAGVKGSI